MRSVKMIKGKENIEKLGIKPQLFATNNPGLILILVGFHKLPVLGTMEAEDRSSKLFGFDNTDELQKCLSLWEELESEDEDATQTLHHYIYRTLNKSLRQDFDQLINALRKSYENKQRTDS